jgi:hypothetical protein
MRLDWPASFADALHANTIDRTVKIYGYHRSSSAHATHLATLIQGKEGVQSAELTLTILIRTVDRTIAIPSAMRPLLKMSVIHTFPVVRGGNVLVALGILGHQGVGVCIPKRTVSVGRVVLDDAIAKLIVAE